MDVEKKMNAMQRPTHHKPVYHLPQLRAAVFWKRPTGAPCAKQSLQTSRQQLVKRFQEWVSPCWYKFPLQAGDAGKDCQDLSSPVEWIAKFWPTDKAIQYRSI